MVRALVVTNMYPSTAKPSFGRFVYDQVRSIKRLDNVELELFSFSGGARAYPQAVRALKQRYCDQDFDVIHCHYGLTAITKLAFKKTPMVVTYHGTDLNHRLIGPISKLLSRWVDLPASASKELSALIPGANRSVAVVNLPCGVDTERFRPLDKTHSRRLLKLDPEAGYVLFPSNPDRPEKRFRLIEEIVDRQRILTLKDVDPELVPHYVNAANVVVIPSEREGFGLAVLEALACNVPVLATPVGIAPFALEGVSGCLCSEFSAELWSQQITDLIGQNDPRIEGRERAKLLSADAMAKRVVTAWQSLVDSV